MTQTERRTHLIRTLLAENPRYRDTEIPADAQEQKDLLRALMNVREPAPVSQEYLRAEAEYLRAEAEAKGVVRIEDLEPICSAAERVPDEADRGPDAADPACPAQIFLWQGDITRLAADAVVNAANSALLGCFRPLHNCIDNCIHSAAGLALRNACDEIMRAQGHEEPTGRAKITPAFNLPAKYVIHTVGPIVRGELTREDCRLLASCYRSCLEIAEKSECASIAFCCISTGVFGFPQREAAEIAVRTVREYLAETGSAMKVIFNVFKDEDLAIYREILNR